MDPLQTLLKNVRKLGLEFIGLYYSTYPGYVADNFDPSNQNRLFVIVPGVFGYPSKPIWLYPKGSSPLIHNLPQPGELVMVEFNNGRPSQGTWSYAQPLAGKKPEEFRSDKVYGFKSPSGHLVMIDEIDNLITIKHKDGQSVTVKEASVTIVSDNIELTQEAPDQSSPLGNDLDKDVSTALDDLLSLVDGLTQYATAQAAICTSPPLNALAPGLTNLLTKLTEVRGSLVNSQSKFKDNSHLSTKVKLS